MNVIAITLRILDFSTLKMLFLSSKAWLKRSIQKNKISPANTIIKSWDKIEETKITIAIMPKLSLICSRVIASVFIYILNEEFGHI